MGLGVCRVMVRCAWTMTSLFLNTKSSELKKKSNVLSSNFCFSGIWESLYWPSGPRLLGRLQPNCSLELQLPNDFIGEGRLLLNSLTWLLAACNVTEMFAQGPQFPTTASECCTELLTVRSIHLSEQGLTEEEKEPKQRFSIRTWCKTWYLSCLPCSVYEKWVTGSTHSQKDYMSL